MKKSSGFTLLELMLTVTVVGILGAVAIPAFTASTQNSAMTTNTNALISSLLLARNEAVKRGSRVSVCESSDAMSANPSCQVAGSWQDGWVVWADDNNNNAIDAGETVIQVNDAAKGATTTIVGIVNVTNVASFVSTGFPQTTAGLNVSGTFRICDSRGTNYGKAVKILASGRIRGISDLTAIGVTC